MAQSLAQQLDAATQIELFKEFFENTFHAELLENIRRGKNRLIIEFDKLAQFSPELADLLLEEPENTLKAASIAVEQLEGAKNFHIRFKELPDSQEIPIRNLRSNHLAKFIQITGIVRQKTDVRPQVTSARFECPSCGNIISVLQLDSKFREPSSCGQCGRKGKFRLLSKELVDAQKIVLEEAPDNLDGGEQPKRLNIFLYRDLVAPMTDRRTNPGSKIAVTGYLKEVPVTLSTGGQSTRFDLVLESNFVEPVEEDYSQINISPEEEQAIKELSQDPDVLNKLVGSLAPSIYGHDKIKEAMMLQLLGGVKKTRSDGVITRGDLHVLLVGDPGAGKSQLLKRATKVAPKSRFVSGKGASGAGLTASVVKDEFMRGWALEAGALVLANKGFCMIDELDKMSDEDRSAFHEALEQQCYHYDTEFLFADGSTKKIGAVVEDLFEKHAKEVIAGKDCEILPTQEVELLTTDFCSTYPHKAVNVSRHKAPDEFVKLSFSNGRSITVTPEHPVFTYLDGPCTMRADQLQKGMLCPAPRVLRTKQQPATLQTTSNSDEVFPQTITGSLAKLIGYHASEGHAYKNSDNSYFELGVSNTDEEVTDEVSQIYQDSFNKTPSTNVQLACTRLKATRDLVTVRCCSQDIYAYFEKHFSQLLHKSPQKRLGNLVRSSQTGVKALVMRAAFRGDGFVSSSRCGLCTASFGLAKDYQDVLLMLGVESYISTEQRLNKEYFKVVVTGERSLRNFHALVASDPRASRVEQLVQISSHKRNDHDRLPAALVSRVAALERDWRMSSGAFYKHEQNGSTIHRETLRDALTQLEDTLQAVSLSGDARAVRTSARIRAQDIASACNLSPSTVYYAEKRRSHWAYEEVREVALRQAEKKVFSTRQALTSLWQVVDGDLRYVTVTDVQRVENGDQAWVYDVQVEPTHAFIGEGLVLHNTVTISKANIQATLRCETVVLAAANPKFGRFDPYEMLAKQIELPSTLINRFDLIFPVRDLPSRDKDDKMANFILKLHQTGDVKDVSFETDNLTKYVSYARGRVFPRLSDEALDEIQKFYVDMRNSGAGEEGISAIPISARQLEALVRLSEASARSRLSEEVTGDDAARAIGLVMYCLEQLGVDPDTGKMDIDRLTTGVTASTRNQVHLLKSIIKELAELTGDPLVPEEEILAKAEEKGVDELKAEEILEKLNRLGDIFRPKPGFYSMMK